MKTLLGPGYYNPNYDSRERLAPSQTFQRERTLTFDPKVIDEYAKETGRIKLDQASRNRDKASKKKGKGANTLYDFRKKLQHENLMNSL